MPNLQQLYKLKEKYGDVNTSRLKKSDIQTLLEAFDPDTINNTVRHNLDGLLVKSFSFRDFKAVDYISYFHGRKKADVVLLFIDITSFSTKFIDKSADELVVYLDEYYSKVIPLVNKYGGEIEKIMGDGIVCVFGKPFLDEGMDIIHTKAYQCAREIISSLHETAFAVKIALHYGEIMYYQNPCTEYYEYTMIGNAITELFRLEAVAEPNSINFYGDSHFDKTMKSFLAAKDRTIYTDLTATWFYKAPKAISLAGVKHQEMRCITYAP